MDSIIRVMGAAQNNLKNITVDIPKGKIVVFAGVSGSGKSSLVFDTIAVEANRQWQASYPLYLRNKMPHYERPRVDKILGLTPAIVVDQKPLSGGSRSTVATAVDVAPLLRLLFSRVGNPSAGGSMAYSSNHPLGMCPTCSGLGLKTELDEDSLFHTDLSLAEGAIQFSQFSSGWQTYIYQKNSLFPADKPLKDFTPQEWNLLKYGKMGIEKISIPSNNTGKVDMVDYEGVIPRFTRLYLKRDISRLKKSLQDEILSHVHAISCPSCNGTGLNPLALSSRINGKNITDVLSMNVTDLLDFLGTIDDLRGKSLAEQIASYLVRMVDVGIGYLALNRKTETLSGGEAQRLRLVRNLGSSLSDITYIFDEPTAGLHPADVSKVIRMFNSLKEENNNVLIVEHSKQIMAIADHIIELGPGSGSHGGKIVFEGTFAELKSAKTNTAKSAQCQIQINKEPLPWRTGFEIKDAHCNNLKNVNVTIPKGVLTVITGVAGSGKSTLLHQAFAPKHPEAIIIDQKPIGTSIRSTPATYTGVMDEIRGLFAKENSVKPGWFSFNSEGACPVCKGKGEISYEMAFAEPVTVPCEECRGHRYNKQALSYKYHEKNIEEVLNLTIADADSFFDNEKIHKMLKSMMDVGLSYLTLGQPTSTLSGGEIQRVKLASELYKTGNIYCLDEPCRGLHRADIEKLIKLLRNLVEQGNTVVVIEHRPEFIAGADWIIDMGPDGGEKGGEIIFCGTPRDLVKCSASKTGKYLLEAAELCVVRK